jgi:hypothetical protein
MNIAKKENLDLSTAYNEIINSIPIDIITITFFVVAFVSLLILIYIKLYSKNISAEQKEILHNKRGIRLLVSFCITALMLAVVLILSKSIFWIGDNLPDGSGALIGALIGILILLKWKWFLNKEV